MDKMTFKDSIAAASVENQQEVMGTPAEEASNVEQPAANGGGERKPRPELDEALMCPRCHSNDTKFCYYNNHSLLQPRYLCKACRRYWTQGGTLRHVREGSACRKIRRTSSSLAPSSSSIDKQPQQHLTPASWTVEQDFPNFLPIVKQEFPDMLPTQLQLMPIEQNFPNVLPMQLQQHLAPVSSTVEQDFPNVLPTFMSSCFDLPGSHLPFPPPSLSSLPPAPPLPSGVETLSFMDLLTGSFDCQSNCIYGPTSSSMEAPPFGFGVVKQNGVVGDDHGGAPPIDGGEGTTAASTHQGGQWPMIKQEFGADQEEEEEGVPDTDVEK